MSLGVGKLNDARLSQALVNFMQEGVRYAFEGDRNDHDNLFLGSRLPFLRVLSKYATWIKKNKSHREILADVLISKEGTLRAHPEFDEVHEDDMRCITEFQEALGMTIPNKKRMLSRDSDGSVDRDARRSAGTPGSSAPSTGSRRALSVAGSQRSRVSVQSNLSPLIESPGDREAEEEEEEDTSPSPQKRRRLAQSLPELNESRIDEESDSDDSAF